MSGPTFFVDRALGRRFPDALEGAGFTVERHAEHFLEAVADTVWIQEVAKRGWYAISKDRMIYRNPVELHSVLSHGLGYFVLRGAGATHADLAANFLDLRGEIERFIGRHPRPFVASVARPSAPGRRGSVRLTKTIANLRPL